MSSVDKNNKNWVLEVPPDPTIVPDPRGIGFVFFDKSIEYENNYFQMDSETGKTETYGEIRSKSVRVALEMKIRGITSDDIVTLCTYNHMETCLPLLASMFLGVRVASLDPTLAQSDKNYLLNLVKPSMIFCVPESLESIEEALAKINLKPQIIIFGDTQKHTPFSKFLISNKNEENFQPIPAKHTQDTAFIFFSSGTTGKPKGICVPHYGLLHNSILLSKQMDFSVPLYYTTSYWISHVLFSTMTALVGGCRLICKSYDDKKVLELIQKYNVTYLFLPSSLTYSLTTNPENYSYDTRSLKSVMIGGTTIGKEQPLAIRKLFRHSIVSHVYGLTEASGPFSYFNTNTELDLLLAKPLSCGRMPPGMSYKIVDIETNEILGPNKPGELLLKTKCLMNEYFNNPEETKKAFDEEGFLRTGDVAYYDEEKCCYIVDRIKEMFKYQSWHIVPADLEDVLLKHPAVKEAIVVGIPHEIDGDHPMAVVKVNNGYNVSEHEIFTYFNERVIERNKLRAGIKFVNEIPKTSTGKYNRGIVRNMVINGEIK